jgi:hypothetical protein
MLLLHLIISNHSFQYVDRPPVFSLLFIESSESSEILRLPPNVTSTSSRSTIISDICHSQLQFKLLRLITPHSSLPIQKLTHPFHCAVQQPNRWRQHHQQQRVQLHQQEPLLRNLHLPCCMTIVNYFKVNA